MAGLSTHASYSQSVMYLPTPSTGKTRTPVELEISLKESRKNKITDRAMLPVTIDRNFHGGNRTPIVSPIKGIPSTIGLRQRFVGQRYSITKMVIGRTKAIAA